ncbi:PrsW family intramembrane metalloprotease [Halomarina ordinaria]|uniref:PrsW family intramembrane metalloprotease n=1 Tax=Halomarina ordinaria TaxID=3033939 RepID=A0ABD5UBK8_9EURY|nr:PrsW family intramembrane metalloprotease [Halomarina sp. PSRA2]
MGERDPVEARSQGGRDLYDVATWEPRSALDRLALKVYGAALAVGKWFVVLLALVFTALIGVFGALTDPIIGAFTVLSVIPALALAGYVYYADITSGEPLWLLTATFVLSIFFASFAAIINSVFGGLQLLGPVGFVLFFYLVVGPVEESVKLLAVRLYAYRDDRFDAVIDGAVYGAVAGLGFAFVENAIYINRGLEMSPGGGPETQLATAGGTAALRALAGPGHVVYSAFAGYYLGLAKFNPENAGPIVAKGLLIAAFIHATYNTLVSVVPSVAVAAFDAVPQFVVFFVFVLIYQGFFGYLLYRKIARYRNAYREVRTEAERKDGDIGVETTEFDS